MGFPPHHHTGYDGVLATAVKEMAKDIEIKGIKKKCTMTKRLRKRHLQIWATFAVLLPTGIVFSWLVIPNPVPIKRSSVPDAELLPLIQAEKNNLQNCISIRTDKDKTQWQLEWTNKFALTVPSAVIYHVTDTSTNISKATLIGRIEARGHYIFPLKIDSMQNNDLRLLLYDFIHEKVIDTINLNISASPAGGVARR